MFLNTPRGLSDWSVDTLGKRRELQIASAYQNWGVVCCGDVSESLAIRPSEQPRDYSEYSSRLPAQTRSNVARHQHTLRGGFIFSCRETGEAHFDSPFIGGFRLIRLLKKANDTPYQKNSADRDRLASSLYFATSDALVFRRRYGDTMYQAHLYCSTAEALYSREILLRFPPGDHLLSLTISMIGNWREQDLQPIEQEAPKLLNQNIACRYHAMAAEIRDVASTQLESIAMLARNDSFLAGAPRFLSYFGRDTLLFLSALCGILSDKVIERAFYSLLSRISENGQVSHEEMMGEFASLSSTKSRRAVSHDFGRNNEPIQDYTMVDDDFLLPAVLSQCLDQHRAPISRLLSNTIEANGKTATGFDLLATNLLYCRRQMLRGLVPYCKQSPVGDWRDSLCEQRICYSYEVNVGLAQAAQATEKALFRQFPSLMASMERMSAGRGETRANFQWSTSLIDRLNEQLEAFCVSETLANVDQKVDQWLQEANFSDVEREILVYRLREHIMPLLPNTLRANRQDYSFYALALHHDFTPLEIQHNDVAFRLLFGDPSQEELDMILLPLETYFPLGLRTDAGMLISNPLFYRDSQFRCHLDREHYHGLVIWPLMHILLMRGIERQIDRRDLAADYKQRLLSLYRWLNNITLKIPQFATTELYTFTVSPNGERPCAFIRKGDRVRSNPAQLWSCSSFAGFISARDDMLAPRELTADPIRKGDITPFH